MTCSWTLSCRQAGDSKVHSRAEVLQMVSTCCLSKETPPAHLAELWPLEPLYTANQHYVHTVLIVVAIVVFTSLNLLRMCVIIVQTSLILILSITHPVCLLCHSMMYSLMIPIPPINYFPATTHTRAGCPRLFSASFPVSSFHPSQDERPGWEARIVGFEKQGYSMFLPSLASLTAGDWCMKARTVRVWERRVFLHLSYSYILPYKENTALWIFSDSPLWS